ncbi:nucleotide exchange factor GrpE [Glaciecola sp. 1036]|uniref:nucleotide exchange factor GrpE n=1 Tax=Alteromonadaceae TaxID=72275 RepID=UPI003D020D12
MSKDQEHEQTQDQATDSVEQPEVNEADSNETENQDTQQNVDGLTVEQAQIQSLEAELEEAKRTIDEQKDRVIRAIAESDNVRKRAEQDVEKARKFALERFAGELLSVIDNLERATMSADAENEAVKPLLEGVELTHKSFMASIEKFGIEVIDPQGEAFNPEHHQAMSMQESADVAPNTVIAVMQKGYLINGRLLRPAMVMVSRAPSEGVDTTA